MIEKRVEFAMSENLSHISDDEIEGLYEEETHKHGSGKTPKRKPYFSFLNADSYEDDEEEEFCNFYYLSQGISRGRR